MCVYPCFPDALADNRQLAAELEYDVRMYTQHQSARLAALVHENDQSMAVANSATPQNAAVPAAVPATPAAYKKTGTFLGENASPPMSAPRLKAKIESTAEAGVIDEQPVSRGNIRRRKPLQSMAMEDAMEDSSVV